MTAPGDLAQAWFDAEHAVLVGMVQHTGSWQLAWTMSTFLRRRSYGRDWLATQRAALQAAQRAGDVTGQANAAFHLAMAEFRYGDRDAADEALSLAVTQFHLLADDYGLASTYHLRCLRSEGDGDFAAAFTFALAGFRHYRQAGHLAGQGRALGAMGWYQAKQGKLAQGLNYCQAALTLSTEARDVAGTANSWDSIGHINLQLGNLDDAANGYARSIALYRELGDRYNLVSTLTGLGETQAARGESPAAWEEGLAIATALGHPDADQLRTRLQAR